ncbi:hypothetical protein J2Z83_000813 [Virgibacillus natechei]|uniref:DUF3679 domain-containing protein n=1 Tax=Virgibacillus natechei TaxID=1216297 RepID=A0ABS4ICQ5_9BACI|nr:hypothetical protein [Virgibacillus natechei]MBP1968719.1 hypothetical protein [Virgibacillus natechei]UZD11521.1 hypothetical protein OLD84_11170 [Virgibacillus natechei]
MGRSFIVILLLAVFFLTGMMYGMDRGNIASTDGLVDQTESNEPERNQGEIVEMEPIEEKELEPSTEGINIEEPNHFTQRAASFLEAGVKGFYEVVVQVLYQVSQLFF